MHYYIASCVFTSQYPGVSERIQEYIKARFGFEIVRCCVPGYKIKEFTEKMPEGCLRNSWSKLPDSGSFESGDVVYSLCHNCNNIIEEMHPGVEVHSLWELVDRDDSFVFPNHEEMHAVVQDCWRARERSDEQAAVRSLLDKMHIRYQEADEHHEQTEFCGVSLYRAQPPRNPKLAPRHYVDAARGKFIPHTEEEQEQIMRNYCGGLPHRQVICYCHYCLEGLLLGGAEAVHIAQLLFGDRA